MIRIRWASMKDPVVHVDDLKAWLRGKRVKSGGRALKAVVDYHNWLMGELVREIDDAEKEG